MKFRPIAILLAFVLAVGLTLPVLAGPTSKPATPQPSKSERVKQETENPRDKCDSSYPDVCIPLYPPDLNCGDISERGFRVTGSDPHKFDRDKDGIGCES